MKRLWIPFAVWVCAGIHVAAQGSHRTVSTSAFSGGDLGLRLSAADAALGEDAGTIEVDTPGTLASAVNLRANHLVHLTVPITLAAPIHFATGDTLLCNGESSLITSTLPYNAAILQPAEGADGLLIENCSVASMHNYFVSLPTGTHVTNFRMRGVYGHQTNLFLQANPAGTLPSSNLVFDHNIVAYAAADPQQGEGGIVLSGPVRDVTASGNHFTGGGHGIEQFGADAAAYPDLQKIIAAHSSNSTYIGNSCNHVAGACIWGSVMNAVVIANNVADGCGDVCFDAEGSAHVTIEGNTAQGCGFGCFSQFFSAYSNSFRNNTGISTSSPIILFKNADPGVPQHQQHTALANNLLSCTGSVPCPAMYLESNYETLIEGNTIVNGNIVSSNNSPLISLRNNTITFSVITTAGLTIPNQVDGGLSQISGNVIRSTTTQAPGTPCMVSVSSGYSVVDTYVIQGNTCSGFGTPDLHLTNVGGNRGVPTFWTVTGNSFPHLAVVVDGSNPATGYIHSGNCNVDSCDTVTAGSAKWTSGAAVPTGACHTGDLYTNTAGQAGSTFFVCQNAVWAAK